VVAQVLGALSVLVIALSAWITLRPGAGATQTGLVEWFNHPPQPFATALAIVNPLLRPLPLVLVALLLVGWVLLAAPRATERLEILRALVVALVLSELMAQMMKRLADQPRPLWVIPGLDMHGYPTDPHGNSYPSAHTALVVAAVSALWPWMRWPQRAAGLAFAVLVACNRIYIGAHWPIDVVGGAAIGLLAGTITWLIATNWPIRTSRSAEVRAAGTGTAAPGGHTSRTTQAGSRPHIIPTG
jgi:undecaprenyl-diphosphatase